MMNSASVAVSPLWSELTSRPILLLDVAILIVVCTIHLVSIQSPARDAEDKTKLAEAVRGGATGGLTIVGILIPLTVLAIQMRAGSSAAGQGLSSAVLIDFFVGDVWLVVSLAFGLYVVFVAAMRGTYEDVGQRKDVVALFGLQLMFLFVGVFRIVWGLSGLVGSLLPSS